MWVSLPCLKGGGNRWTRSNSTDRGGSRDGGPLAVEGFGQALIKLYSPLARGFSAEPSAKL